MSQAPHAPLPLEGITVLDLSNVIAGPLATYHLAMVGARVIKVEIPKVGDLSRKLGVDPELSKRLMGTSFLAMNAGKESITLDLKKPAGRGAFERLVSRADVVVENFRPGTMDRLGLGYNALSTLNPSLIYCAVSGFGQTGPLSQRPGYDQIIQGLSGLMSLTGSAETAPQRAGYVVCDAMAAVVAAFAITASLAGRSRTGKGEYLDVSMLSASLSTMAAWFMSNIANAGVLPKPAGNENPTSCPSGTFRTADGVINIVCNEEKQFDLLCGALGLEDLIGSQDYGTRAKRLQNRHHLNALVQSKLERNTTSHWDELLSGMGVPAGPILALDAVMTHPHIQHQQLMKQFDTSDEVGRPVSVARLGFRFGDRVPDVKCRPPALGEHTQAILREAGFSDEQIDGLREQAVL